MTETLPAPLTPHDCDLRDFRYMPVEIGRLLGSAFHAEATDSEWRAGFTLWLRSYHQVPAGSLPDDDVALARLAELGRDLRTWKKLRPRALHHWQKCSDGRLYHPVVAEKVLEAWIEKLSQRKSSGAGNAKRHGGAFDPSGLDHEIEITLDLLERLNPNSAALRKRRQRVNSGRSLGTHTAEEWSAMLQICGPDCRRCGKRRPLERDHIKIIAQGGSDDISNIQPLCAPCNSAKGLEDIDYRPPDWNEKLQAILSRRDAVGVPRKGKRTEGNISEGKPSELALERGSPVGRKKPVAQETPLDDSQWVFRVGLQWLQARTGEGESKTRKLLGKWTKEHPVEVVRAALERAIAEGPGEPVSWITAALKQAPREVNGRHDEAPVTAAAAERNFWWNMVRLYKRSEGRTWPVDRGEPPPHRLCQAPADVLEEFGYRQKAQAH